MIKVYNILSILLFVLLVVACNKPMLNQSEFVKYVEEYENGLKRKLDINDWVYIIQYRPVNYILCKENQPASSERAKNLKGTLWFTIQFRYAKANVPALKINVTDLKQYNNRLDYYLNEASKDISLEYGSAILYPISYLFETNYGLTPHETMIVGFALPNAELEIKHNLALKFHDKVFKNGIVKTQIELTDINKIPQIKFN